MEGRISEQDKIINRVAHMHQYQENSEEKELMEYRSLTKTLSGENIRLKEELRKVRSGDNIQATGKTTHSQQDKIDEHSANSADDA